LTTFNWKRREIHCSHGLQLGTKHTEDAERRLDHDWTPYQEEDDDGNKEWQRIPGVFTLNGRYG